MYKYLLQQYILVFMFFLLQRDGGNLCETVKRGGV